MTKNILSWCLELFRAYTNISHCWTCFISRMQTSSCQSTMHAEPHMIYSHNILYIIYAHNSVIERRPAERERIRCSCGGRSSWVGGTETMCQCVRVCSLTSRYGHACAQRGWATRLNRSSNCTVQTERHHIDCIHAGAGEPGTRTIASVCVMYMCWR